MITTGDVDSGLHFIATLLCFTRYLNAGVTQFDPEFRGIWKGWRKQVDQFRHTLSPTKSHKQSSVTTTLMDVNYSQFASYVGEATVEWDLDDPTNLDFTGVMESITARVFGLNGQEVRWMTSPFYKAGGTINPSVILRLKFTRT